MSNRNVRIGRTLAFTFAAVVSASSYAQDAKVATWADQDAVQAHTLLLKAQVAEAEQAKKLMASQPDSVVTTSQGLVQSNARDDADTGLPTVSETWGGSKGLNAAFIYRDGSTAAGGKGDALPGGYRIVSVSMTATVLSKGTKTYVLGNSLSPINDRPQQAAGVMPGQIVGPMNFPAPALPAPMQN